MTNAAVTLTNIAIMFPVIFGTSIKLSMFVHIYIYTHLRTDTYIHGWEQFLVEFFGYKLRGMGRRCLGFMVDELLLLASLNRIRYAMYRVRLHGYTTALYGL